MRQPLGHGESPRPEVELAVSLLQVNRDGVVDADLDSALGEEIAEGIAAARANDEQVIDVGCARRDVLKSQIANSCQGG